MRIEEPEFELPSIKIELNAREVRALLVIMNEYLESENVSEKSINGWVEKEIKSMQQALDNGFYCFLAKLREASGGTGIYIQDEKVLTQFRNLKIGLTDSEALKELLEKM